MEDTDTRVPRAFWVGIALILAGLLVISAVTRAEAAELDAIALLAGCVSEVRVPAALHEARECPTRTLP